MKTSFLLLTLCLFAAQGFCANALCEKTDNGVRVQVASPAEGAPRVVQLEVVTNDIIRVTAWAVENPQPRTSLITAYGKTTNGAEWSVAENDEVVTLSTATLAVEIDCHNGSVVFKDKKGNVLLREKSGGGKTFSPVEVEGKRAWSVRQVFESPEDEAFYGLGQHQSDEFNYKGKNEVLYQYNTKVSVPFVVSTRGYGILWDNYSLTKFGDPRDYGQLNQLRLYGTDGSEGALTATYMLKGDPSNVFVQRSEAAIDYENLETVKNFPEGFSFSGSRITWEGEVEAHESGVHRFLLYYAGYTTLYVDGEAVVPERWRTAWNPNSYKFSLDLKAGQRRKIKLDWRPDGGVSYIGLKLLSPVPDEEQGRLSLWSEMGEAIDYYFIRGSSMDSVIGGYRTVTGKAPIMPKWTMGFWQSRERYKTQGELLATLSEFRRRQIPIDNIVQDWFYWRENDWGSHEFDPARFPDPKAMVDSVHGMKARIMISVWPKFYHTTNHYKAFAERGWMFDRAVKDSVRDWVGKGYVGGFYDAYSEGARKLFWSQINDKLYAKGFDAWWMDASEPDILSNASMSYRKTLMTPTALGSSTEYFNAYALVNADAIYHGQRSVNPNSRVFLLTRSGFAGIQRYSSATWSGDIGTRWEDMKAQISAGLNFAVSGIPYWTMDIGGFCVENRYVKAREGSEDREEWRELNARWFQFGAFCPLFRSHGQTPHREVFHLAPEEHPAYQSMVYYTKLRYRLMPYTYSLAGMAWRNDYTIMRPLVMDFGSDANVRNIGDAYMFGAAFMVCPVYRYKERNREVYFPAGGWYDFETEKYYEGGQTAVVAAPYERMPLFVRAGSIVPTGSDIQSTAEPQTDLTITVYAGRSGEFTLYEDDGVSYDYERGNFSTIKMSYDDSTKTLTIGKREGSFDGMPQKRKFTVKWVAADGAARRTSIVTYSGSEAKVVMR